MKQMYNACSESQVPKDDMLTEREMRGKANHKNDYINNDTNLKRYSNSEYIVIVTNNCLKT